MPTIMVASMGCLVVFHLPEGSSRALHRRFARRVMGEETTSWGGKYRYRRKGLVDGTAHVLLHTGIVLLREEDTPGMCRRVRKEGGVVEVRRVELTRSDQRTFNRASG